MKLTKAKPDTTEATIALKNTSGGDCFRFAFNSLDMSLSLESIYMRVVAPEVGNGLCRIIKLSNGEQQDLSGINLVIVEDATLHLG